MPDIGIVGGGIGGTHLGLFLLRHGVRATICTAKTRAEHLAARLSNVVGRSGSARARERELGVEVWDAAAPDLERLAVTINGPRPLAFSGVLNPPTHVVDMRIYWARMLQEFARGGSLVFRTLDAAGVDALSDKHDLVVAASGRGALASLFPRFPEHSPFQSPQRVTLVALLRGVAYPEPLGFQVTVNRGQGEILEFPLFSFEYGLTALGIEAAPGGAFEALSSFGTSRLDEQLPELESTLLGILRDYAPAVYARIDTKRFAFARPLDVGHVAITPIVRRGYARPVERAHNPRARRRAHHGGSGHRTGRQQGFARGVHCGSGDLRVDGVRRRLLRPRVRAHLRARASGQRRLQRQAQTAGATLRRNSGRSRFLRRRFQRARSLLEIASQPERTEAIKHPIAGTIPANPLAWDTIAELADGAAAV